MIFCYASYSNYILTYLVFVVVDSCYINVVFLIFRCESWKDGLSRSTFLAFVSVFVLFEMVSVHGKNMTVLPLALVHAGMIPARLRSKNFCQEHIVRNTIKNTCLTWYFSHMTYALRGILGVGYETRTHTQRFPHENACQWGQHMRVSVVLRKHEETHPKNITLSKKHCKGPNIVSG